MRIAWLAALQLLACASAPLESRLAGDAIVLLGEVHDNPEHHRRRLALLRRAVEAGWRPALALEQLDRERQADVERGRRERPRDAGYLIEAAGGAGWTWDFYRPFVELALEYDLPLVAANLSRREAREIAQHGPGAVFDGAALARLGLDREVPADWQAAQEREIDAGHCFALPREAWPALAGVQLARDAVMADLLRQHGARGAVLLAGNGHVRRDLGVPRWLADADRVYAVGYIEGGDEPPPGAFDAVVVTARVERPDPCEAFRQKSGT